MSLKKPTLRIVSSARSAISWIAAVRRRHKAEIALKDLSPHILNDIGQQSYRERNELDRDQIIGSSPYFRW